MSMFCVKYFGRGERAFWLRTLDLLDMLENWIALLGKF